MSFEKDAALKVAEFLLQIKAIKLQPRQPFTWASGWQSPIYCDNRKTLSYPNIRTYIRQQFTEVITEKYGKPDMIAGVATGGIAQGALVAQDLGIGFCYVRPNQKGHGLQNQIEGVVEAEQNIVVIEDLVSTGNSSLTAVNALREAGVKVKGMVAIFTYGFELSQQNFDAAQVDLTTLTNYEILMEQALKSHYINESDLESLQAWREDPANWSAKAL